MSIYRGTYYSASGCDSGSRPGTNALMSWFLGAYAERGAANLGTYACKRLGSGWSIHAERRAADLGTAPYGGVDSSWGWNLANSLRLNSAELGIQCIILGRRIWSCSYPDAGWRSYSGQYHGHAHVELIPSAADNLTAEKIERIIGGGSPGTSPAPRPPSDWRKETINMDTVNLSKVTGSSGTWVRGAKVKRLQGLLLAAGHGPGGLVNKAGRPDGIGGPGTRRELGEFQRAKRTGRPSSPGTADFIAGRATWTKLLGE